MSEGETRVVFPQTVSYIAFKINPFGSDNRLVLPQEALLLNPYKRHDNLTGYDFQNPGLLKVNDASVNHCHSESKSVSPCIKYTSKRQWAVFFIYLEMSQASSNPQRSNLSPNKVWGLEKIRLRFRNRMANKGTV